MKAKIVQYGCGKMSVYLMQYAIEKGAKIIGAFDIDKQKQGHDISELMGASSPYGVRIQVPDTFEKFIKSKKPDVVIVATTSLMIELNDVLTLCAEAGVNAITTCEEAFYPQNSNPTVFSKIDKLAKASGATICGSGYQDVYWGNLITTLAGSMQKITKIIGSTSYNVEDYGIALARVHGAGMTQTEFAREVAAADNISEQERNKIIKEGKYTPSYMWNTNGWLASALGLTVTKQTQRCVPQYAKTDLSSSTLGMKIQKGGITGMSAIVTTETAQGVTLQTECIGKVYDKTEFDRNIWTLEGTPNTTIVVDRPATVELTCATVINRIPDLISAKSGYITSEKLPPVRFQK